jgi:hypothetical protein
MYNTIEKYDLKVLAECQRIVKQENPRIRVKTTDVFPHLSGNERMTLYKSERMGLKLLCETNTR